MACVTAGCIMGWVYLCGICRSLWGCGREICGRGIYGNGNMYLWVHKYRGYGWGVFLREVFMLGVWVCFSGSYRCVSAGDVCICVYVWIVYVSGCVWVYLGGISIPWWGIWECLRYVCIIVVVSVCGVCKLTAYIKDPGWTFVFGEASDPQCYPNPPEWSVTPQMFWAWHPWGTDNQGCVWEGDKVVIFYSWLGHVLWFGEHSPGSC